MPNFDTGAGYTICTNELGSALLEPTVQWQMQRSKQAVIKYCNGSKGFPGGSALKNPPANSGDAGLIPELGRLPGEGNGKQLQYSCLGNPMERGDWQATVHRVAKELEMT